MSKFLNNRKPYARCEPAECPGMLNEKDKRQVIFSDEKETEWSDGPKCYWRDLREEPLRINRRDFGGGGLMYGFGRIPAAPVNASSDIYEWKTGPEIASQQDNIPVHVSQSAKAWFRLYEIEALGLSARSPDLNPMENLLSIIIKKGYGNNRQYKNVSGLKTAILQAWQEV
ncbi:hypothetical protein OESDEN_08887, partial [Oesophagostomum dentatum]